MSINDRGAVAGTEFPGLGFLRTPDGKMTTFKAGDDNDTVPLCINNIGVIAGNYVDANGARHGFVRAADGVITNFDAPGAGTANNEGTFPSGINTAGLVTGYYIDLQGIRHGFVRGLDGTVTIFDVSDVFGAETVPLGIDDAGEIVGTVNDGLAHGFVRSANGAFTSFDAPDGVSGTHALAINNKGTVTGYFVNRGSVVRGFIRRPGGALTPFDAGGGLLSTFAVTINGKGTVAGWGSTNLRDNYEGFARYRSGEVIAITGPRSRTYPTGINKRGAVAGYLMTHTQGHYTYHGFIWTP